MNIIKISLDDIKNNFKTNYKLALKIIGICIFIGVICGLISAKTYHSNKVGDVPPVQEHLDFNLLEHNEAYYYNAFLALKEKHDYLAAYLEYFEQVDMSSESRILLDDIQEYLDEHETEFQKAENFYKEEAPFLIRQKEKTISFYREIIDEREITKNNLENKLDEITNGKYTESFKDSEQSRLSKLIITVKADLKLFNNHISIIENRTNDEAQKVTETADCLLTENEATINETIDQFNVTMEKLAQKENYQIIYNKRLLNDYFEKAGFNSSMQQEEILSNQKGKAIVYAKSIAGLDQKKERFFATVTFFMLFGIVVALIVGGTYPSTKRKKLK